MSTEHTLSANDESGGAGPVRDPGDPSLPVAGRGSLASVARSSRARWRAGVLIAVHLAIAAHITHFLVAGRTLSPVEPSEAMYTLELGELNAGFVFFVVALGSTMIFGRFFCGWGCHLVALQDACGWLMKRVGIRPRPFRSRLLLWLPLGLALYMFVWPTLERWIAPTARRLAEGGVLDGPVAWLFAGAPERFPGVTNHLLTDGFWDTFPGPLFTVLTFVSCGFLAVYLLGAKGFCTYGCPYGAFFALSEPIAPGRIRVTDDCNQCGHCTVTCTSNVTVHDEVRRYGMVVDPGCMRCMDCVSVCPTDALYFGFGRPAAFGGKRDRTADGPRRERFPLPFGYELLLLGVAVAATLIFRGLYDGPPLLMSAGLGAMTAFALHLALRVVRRRPSRLQQLVLVADGRVRVAGAAVAAVAGAWLLFAAHSGVVQASRSLGAYHLERTEAPREAVLAGTLDRGSLSDAHERAAGAAHRHFGRAARWGLLDTLDVRLGLAWTHLLRDEPQAAVEQMRHAVAIAPDSPRQLDNLVRVLARAGRLGEAADVDARRLSLLDEVRADDRFRLAALLAGDGRYADAAAEQRAGLELEPTRVDALAALGALYRATGHERRAADAFVRALELEPDRAELVVELALALAAEGRVDEARVRLASLADSGSTDRVSVERARALLEQLGR